MSDRIVRDELWQSTRWLDLPTDTHRLIYISLLTIADDYGNVEGGPRRLYRWMHNFSQVKSDEDSIKIMSDLQDADLARRYEVDGKECWHLPRFRNSRRYWARKCPPSPYKEQEHQETAKDPSAVLREGSRKTSRGVGVGVGEVHIEPRFNHLTRPETDQEHLDKFPTPKPLKSRIEKAIRKPMTRTRK